jgi:SAM-dependent methyltransferase
MNHSLTALKHVTLGLLVIIIALGALHFPYDTDSPLEEREKEAARKYYAEVYKKPAAAGDSTSAHETEYIRIAEIVDQETRIDRQISVFVERFNLGNRPVLEIGSGRGKLQDIARDYTGLDISPNLERFYHKKFVLGSATAMPFIDSSFDGVWSIAVFEHIPNPEQALFETRRVMKDGAVLFFLPAWNARPWAADGYEVRPYSDFGLMGKMVKGSIPLRSSVLFRAASLLPVRIVRQLYASLGTGPTTFHYRRLTPNYETYWVADSDAVNSIDSHEAMLWFTTRGDECLSCKGPSLLLGLDPLIIRIHKK